LDEWEEMRLRSFEGEVPLTKWKDDEPEGVEGFEGD